MQAIKHAIIHSAELKKLYAPQRNIICIVIETKRGEETLIKLLSYCASRKVRLLSTSITLHPDSPRAYITSILDVTSMNLDVASLVKEIRSLPYIHRAEVLETPMTRAKARLITFTLREFSSIIKGAYEKFEEAGAVFLYFLGYEMGLHIAEDITEKYSDYDALNHFFFWIRALGWGDCRITKYIDKKEVIIEAKNLFECMVFLGEKTASSSHLFRGLLAGFTEAIWGRKTEVIEETCIACGDPVCRFIVRATGLSAP